MRRFAWFSHRAAAGFETHPAATKTRAGAQRLKQGAGNFYWCHEAMFPGRGKKHTAITPGTEEREQLLGKVPWVADTIHHEYHNHQSKITFQIKTGKI
jgi:hypothetical protein